MVQAMSQNIDSWKAGRQAKLRLSTDFPAFENLLLSAVDKNNNLSINPFPPSAFPYHLDWFTIGRFVILYSSFDGPFIQTQRVKLASTLNKFAMTTTTTTFLHENGLSYVSGSRRYRQVEIFATDGQPMDCTSGGNDPSALIHPLDGLMNERVDKWALGCDGTIAVSVRQIVVSFSLAADNWPPNSSGLAARDNDLNARFA